MSRRLRRREGSAERRTVSDEKKWRNENASLHSRRDTARLTSPPPEASRGARERGAGVFPRTSAANRRGRRVMDTRAFRARSDREDACGGTRDRGVPVVARRCARARVGEARSPATPTRFSDAEKSALISKKREFYDSVGFAPGSLGGDALARHHGAGGERHHGGVRGHCCEREVCWVCVRVEVGKSRRRLDCKGAKSNQIFPSPAEVAAAERAAGKSQVRRSEIRNSRNLTRVPQKEAKSAALFSLGRAPHPGAPDGVA